MFPNADLEAELKAAFSKCKPCRIIFNACSGGLYYGPIRDLAKNTGCVVCGQTTPGEGEIQGLQTNAFRCVDSAGNQVMGAGHTPFDAAHLGYPPNPPWKPLSIPLCEDPLRYVPIGDYL